MPEKSVQPSAMVTQITDGDADQHRDVLQKAAGEFDHQKDDRQHQAGDDQIAGGAEIGLAGAAARPIHADAHQHDADHGDDGAGDDGRERTAARI